MNYNRVTDPHSNNTRESNEWSSLRRPSVLIIDDDTDLTETLKALLQLEGFVVTTYNRAVDALRKVMERDFDAIICDMVMPTLRGDMFYLAVSKVKPHLCKRFIFVTAYGSDPSIAAFLSATERPVLHKPVAIDDILDVLLHRCHGVSVEVPSTANGALAKI